jgi:hypothetical protein
VVPPAAAEAVSNTAGALVAPVLPEGWTRFGPDAAGDFWYEHVSGTTQWELPTASLPDGWRRMYPDDGVGDCWYEHVSGTTQWEIPEPSPTAASASGKAHGIQGAILLAAYAIVTAGFIDAPAAG